MESMTLINRTFNSAVDAYMKGERFRPKNKKDIIQALKPYETEGTATNQVEHQIDFIKYMLEGNKVEHSIVIDNKIKNGQADFESGETAEVALKSIIERAEKLSGGAELARALKGILSTLDTYRLTSKGRTAEYTNVIKSKARYELVKSFINEQASHRNSPLTMALLLSLEEWIEKSKLLFERQLRAIFISHTPLKDILFKPGKGQKDMAMRRSSLAEYTSVDASSSDSKVQRMLAGQVRHASDLDDVTVRTSMSPEAFLSCIIEMISLVKDESEPKQLLINQLTAWSYLLENRLPIEFSLDGFDELVCAGEIEKAIIVTAKELTRFLIRSIKI